MYLLIHVTKYEINKEMIYDFFSSKIHIQTKIKTTIFFLSYNPSSPCLIEGKNIDLGFICTWISQIIKYDYEVVQVLMHVTKYEINK